MIRLKELRKAHNKTLKDVAEAFNTSPQVISRYELEQTEPDFATLNKLADYFDVSIDYLLGRTDSPTLMPDKELIEDVTFHGGTDFLEIWKARKRELKLTLDEIAEKTGISISTIKDIFRGATYAPRVDTVQAIERVLGINDNKTIFDISGISPKFVSLYNSLSPMQQEKVIAYMEGLLACK